MRTGLLSDLSVIGYEIFLEGENIRLRYQKPDTPPESARLLIEELRKYKAEVMNILKTGNIRSTEKTQPKANTKVIWRNPYPQGSPEVRQESLEQAMTAIWESTFDRVAAIWPKGFVSTLRISTAEIEIERVQALILSAKAKIADFRQAVEAWERIVTQGVNADERY